MSEYGKCIWETALVKSVAWKVEKKAFERSYVLRMGNNMLPKALEVGWYEFLEGYWK